jgi:hypothetical protein
MELPDFVSCMLDKEMELSLHQMMARLLKEMKSDINAQVVARQEKADAEAKPVTIN